MTATHRDGYYVIWGAIGKRRGEKKMVSKYTTRKRTSVVKVDEKFLKELETLAARELTQRQIYEYYAITKKNWFHLKEEYPQIDERLRKGKAQCQSFVTSKLYELIEEKNFNAIKLYLETKGGWQKAPTLEEEENARRLIETKLGMDAIEAAKIYQKIILGNK